MTTDYLNPWLYHDNPFTSEMIGDAIGFVYLIEGYGKKYLGKKLFLKSKTRQVKKKKKKIKVESDWKTYYGSNELLQKDVKEFGQEKFKRTILMLCYSKGELSYYEAKYQFQEDVLLKDEYYNTWIYVRVRNTHLTRKKKVL